MGEAHMRPVPGGGGGRRPGIIGGRRSPMWSGWLSVERARSSRKSMHPKMAAMHCTAGSSGASASWPGAHSAQHSSSLRRSASATPLKATSVCFQARAWYRTHIRTREMNMLQLVLAFLVLKKCQFLAKT